MTETEKRLAPLVDQMEEALPNLQARMAEVEHLKQAAEKNQSVIDQAAVFLKDAKKGNFSQKKNFGDSFSDEIKAAHDLRLEEIKSFTQDRKGKFSITLKEVGNMTTSNLTGDGVASYGSRQGLIPNQKVNFRDLVPTTQSPTGVYVHYRETGGEGGFGVQTEGAAKSKVDYDLTEVKTVSKYIAGIATFSKHLMFHLPFLQSTLTRLLMRDFYKKENDYFWSLVAANATGSVSSSETDDNKQLIDYIMQILDSNFNASFILVKNSQKGRLLKLLYDNHNYFGAGSIIGTPDGNISVAGVPIVGASFASDDKVMIIDSEMIERIETESMRVDFSFENQDNFEKNLVTARLECFEELNLLRTDAHFYLDMGNAS